jgi:hypothetical protein
VIVRIKALRNRGLATNSRPLFSSLIAMTIVTSGCTFSHTARAHSLAATAKQAASRIDDYLFEVSPGVWTLSGDISPQRLAASLVRGGIDFDIVSLKATTDEIVEMLRPYREDPAKLPVLEQQLRARLRPVEESDLPVLWRAWCDPLIGPLWRGRGSTPEWGSFAADLWTGVDEQFIVETTSTEPVGLVASYGRSPDQGWVWFAFTGLVSASRSKSSALVFEGALLMLDKLFSERAIRKVLIELPEGNAVLCEGLVDAENRSGKLHDHVWAHGQWSDVVLQELWRSRWMDLTAPLRVPPALVLEGLFRIHDGN